MKQKEDFVGFCEHEYCPIIRQKTANLLASLLHEHKPKKILEIGTFIGYSAYLMLAYCDAEVVSVEIDSKNYAFASKNLAEFGDRVKLKNCDALDFLKQNNEKFDFVFLDGAKGQYIKYLPYLKKLLARGGVLMADDVLFYGKVLGEEHVEHKHRSLVNNLRKFLEELKNDSEFDTILYDFEDGVSVSIKK